VGEIELPDPILLVEILSPGNAKQTWENVWCYATMPSVREIVVLQSSRIEADLLIRQADGSWPSEPARVMDGNTLLLPSLDFAVPLRTLYAKTYLDR
jgi:hypothetical protein